MSSVLRSFSFSSLAPALLAFLVLVLLNLGPRSAQAQLSRKPCTTSCVCMGGLVTCRRSDLISIPSNFGQDTNHLIMTDQPFIDKTLRRHNISYLHRMTQLDMKGCGIEALEVGVFSDLKQLTSIDLSNNNIRVIQDYTFRGLTLKYLFLNKNSQLKLRPKSFTGLSTKTLSMDNCGLKELSFETFLALNNSIRSVWLSKNELVDFDPRFEFLFSHLQTLDVTENPFRCKCRLRWLVRYTKHARTDSSMNGLSGPSGPMNAKQPRCASPPALAGIELRSLKVDQLTCDPPRLGNVEVAMTSADSGRLRCAASGYPSPVILWRRQGNQRALHLERPRPASAMHLMPGRPHDAEVLVERQRRIETYECLAYNAGGNVTLTVRLHWPPRSPAVVSPPRGEPPKVQPGDRRPPSRQRPTATSAEEGRPGGGRRNTWLTRENPGLEEEEDNPFFQKKFTLLELIGAVVGTFTATLALFLLICRCITYARKKQKKQQWSTYESAYSGSHVYDVPRHDQAPYMAAKTSVGTADRHEFLDFKTGRKVYDHV